MSSPYQNPKKRTFILELDYQEVKLLGQLLLMRILDAPEENLPKKAFESLRMQTDAVKEDESFHGLVSMNDGESSIENLKKSNGRFYREIA